MEYEMPEVIEIGTAQEVILGTLKDGFSSDFILPMPELALAVDEMDG